MTKMVKQILFAAMAGLAVWGLSACNPPEPQGTTGSTGTSTSNTNSKPKIAVSIPTATHGWTAGVVYWANQAAKDFADQADIEVVTSETASDQAKKLETIASQGYDSLVILSFEPDVVTPVVKANRNSFGYIVSVDRGLTDPIADVWLRGDNVEFGKVAAQFMAEKLGGKGNILVFRGIAGPVDDDRVKGFTEEIAKSPGIKILDMPHGDWNRDKSFSVAQNMLTKFPKIDAIWAADDDMAMGIQRALQEANRTNIWLVGGGGMKDVVDLVQKGDPMFPATVTYSPRMIYDGIKRAVEDLAAGKKPGGEQVNEIQPVELVTPKNAKDHYFPESTY